MNNINKSFMNEDGTEEQVVASSNDSYKVNLNDSYERLVYYTNGKKMRSSINNIIPSLKQKIEQDIIEKNIQNKDEYIINYITNLLKYVNIQSEIIDDYVKYLYRQKNLQRGICRRNYNLNIADNRNLHFTDNCLKIDFIKLSKPLADTLNNIDNDRLNTFYILINDLKVISKELDADYEDTKVRIKRY